MSGDSEVGQSEVLSGQPASPRTRMQPVPNRNEVDSEAGHLGVDGGCGGGVDSIALSDWIQPAVSGNDIAMCFSIIYVCPGQHVSVAFGERYTTLLGLGAPCWPTAMSTDVSVPVPSLWPSSSTIWPTRCP